jgi:hypothetical protein
VGFFAKNALPELSLSRITSQQIEWLIQRATGGDVSADFD